MNRMKNIVLNAEVVRTLAFAIYKAGVAEEKWDEHLAVYYAFFHLCEERSKEEPDKGEEMMVDFKDKVIVSLSLDSESEKTEIRYNELGRILNLRTPFLFHVVEKSYLTGEIIRRMADGYYRRKIRPKRAKGLFSKVRQYCKDEDNRKKMDEEYERYKTILHEPYLTRLYEFAKYRKSIIEWYDLYDMDFKFTREVCNRVNPQNPPDFERLQNYLCVFRNLDDECDVSLRELMEMDEMQYKIIISDVESADFKYVHIETDDGEKKEIWDVGSDRIARMNIHLQTSQKLTKEEAYACVFTYILYPIRMKRQLEEAAMKRNKQS